MVSATPLVTQEPMSRRIRAGRSEALRFAVSDSPAAHKMLGPKSGTPAITEDKSNE